MQLDYLQLMQPQFLLVNEAFAANFFVYFIAFFYLQLMQLGSRCGVTLPQIPPESPPQGEDGMVDEESETSNSSSTDSVSDFKGGRAIPYGIVDEIFEFTGAFDYGIHTCIYVCILYIIHVQCT